MPSLHSALKLDRVQITLHGSKDFHNKGRPYVNGKESYRDVIDGICTAVNLGIRIVEIRINIDEENMHSLDILFDDLREYGLAWLENLRVYPFPVTQMTDSSKKYKVEMCWSSRVFKEIEILDDENRKRGFWGLS
jgi:uncharacterized protein